MQVFWGIFCTKSVDVCKRIYAPLQKRIIYQQQFKINIHPHRSKYEFTYFIKLYSKYKYI